MEGKKNKKTTRINHNPSLRITHKQFQYNTNLTKKQIRDEGKEQNKSRNEMSKLVKQLLQIHLNIKKNK